MLQNLLASIGVLAVIVVTFARMTVQARRPLGQPVRSTTLLPPRRRRPF